MGEGRPEKREKGNGKRETWSAEITNAIIGGQPPKIELHKRKARSLERAFPHYPPRFPFPISHFPLFPLPPHD
jgi:hypothetical protein